MREILFRAKRLYNGEWVEGSYFHCQGATNYSFQNNHYILAFDDCGVVWHKIDKETICQFTGLTDKNGKKIWENDIVSEDFGNYKGVIRFGNFESMVLKNVGFNIEWMGGIYYRQDLMYWAEKCEVIGSIFDNPELLKGGSE